MAKKTNDQDRLSALISSVNDEMLGDDVPRYLDDHGLKVERILLDLIRPDPVQPRRVMPARLHSDFHEERLTPTQALREVVKLAQVAARQRGRPFGNVLELLPPGADDDSDGTDDALTPEETLLRDLVNLAVTLRDDGQVNPITVIDTTQSVVQQYRIETGERRYWAAWVLRDFFFGYESDGMINCLAVYFSTCSASAPELGC